MTQLVKSNSLKDIMDSFHTLENWVVEANGELTPELEQLIEFNLTQLSEKADGYHFVMERLDQSTEFFDNKAKFYKKLADGFEATKSRIKERVKFVMIENGMDEVCGNEIRFKLQNNAPSVQITDEHSIPKEYIETVVTEKINKSKLRDALELGLEIVGAQLVRGKQLRTYAVKK